MTATLRRLAEATMTDQVTIVNRTIADEVDPNTGQTIVTDTNPQTVRALVQQQTANRNQLDGRTLSLEDRIVKLPADTVVRVGQTITVDVCAGDGMLVGRSGKVTAVEQAAIRAQRRATVRFA